MSRLERIAAELGGLVFDGGRRALVRGPDHGPADRSVSLIETEDGRILIHCFSPRDDWRAVRDALRARGLLEEKTDEVRPAIARPKSLIVQPHTEERAARARRIWVEARPVRCTPAAAYLKRRGIVDAETEQLRFHPRMTSIDDRLRRPALLAVIRDAADQVQGIQATLLTSYGVAKAPVATPRRVIGGLVGGAVQLHAAAPTLIIAEGVESALSAAQVLGAPAWAALTAYNLSLFEPPAGVEHLIVAADNDAAGLNAAAALRERLSSKLDVELALPTDGYADWNDVVSGQHS